MKLGPRWSFLVCAAWLAVACAQTGERSSLRAPASSKAEAAPARPISTSLANDPLAAQPADDQHQHQHGGGAASALYTCGMHPEVQQAGPGECPKCGMRLVQKPADAHPPSPNAEPQKSLAAD